MPTSGDVVDLELGAPEAREAGFRHHPAVVVTNGLDVASAAQCQHINVGVTVLAQIRETIAIILDVP